MQQRPLYIRVRSILEILSTLWLISAVIGVGFFSGGTTSLAFSLILLYSTGAALLVVISALYRVLSRAARQRVEAVPDDSAAAVFVDTTRSATEEIMAALRPAAPYGTPGASVRMPSTVDALDVAAALTARTAALTSAAAAEKSAAAAAAMVAPGKSGSAAKSVMNKSVVNKSASKKKAAPKQPAQPTKAQAAKTRPANNNGSRGTGNQASTAPKKSTGGKKPGSAGKGAGGDKASNSGSAGTKKPERATAPEVKAAPFETGMSMPGIRTAQQDILPRQTGAPSCGLAGPTRLGGPGPRQLVAA
ncbi:hypothetical protein NNX28_16590 [Arthrobacter sp. zg-Y859]|uniref:Uncharacterized protein n=1 Tax=Arthrobacter jinronghuae TaxID=2964609 RepID=A0ABT1NXV8_9MICC|nr:hypothetical protein [Arthrobacter jinronghuae]MCQ1951539.1 hypothetical protein [Arthrobacter jinronghuae]UWX79617.1 hypothetical protein N2K98_05280 [Arthrobacter jinronghuae]